METRKELETVQYLRKYGLEQLVKEYKVDAKRHKMYPNLVLLKYDQLESDMSSTIIQVRF